MKLNTVVRLLGFTISTPALAIGLGDLSVHSYLGQPLHVAVKVLSPPATLSVDCLSLRPGDSGLPLPGQAQFRIEPKGENALLHITTPQAISDPIAQFRLVSDCEGRLEREYVLLLDLPMPVEPAELAPPEPDRRIASGTPPSEAPIPVRAAAPAATVPPPARLPRAPVARSRRDAPPKPVARTDSPRLVISGKKSPTGAGSTPAGVAKDGAAPAPSDANSFQLTTTDLSDENTALNRRLAHLESQLAALQKRNAEIEAQLAAASVVHPEPVAGQARRWPIYLIVLGLLVGGGASLAWMRRRNRPINWLTEPLPWTPPRKTKLVSAGAVVDPALAHFEPMLQDDSLQPSPAPVTPRQPDLDDFPLTAVTAGTEVKDDVVHQAEVFIAHGHLNQAIQLLREHLRATPAESPVPWMLLLDLLQRERDEAGYAAASSECRRHFNVNVLPHPASDEQNSSHGLESYPHILDMLTQAWNTPELDAMFQALIHDRRGGVRVGFAPAAYRDLLFLLDIARVKTLSITA